LPQPKLVAKVIESDPDIGFDATLLVSNFGAPVIRNKIKPNFGTDCGDAVEIAFDQTGIILGITRSGNHLRC